MAPFPEAEIMTIKRLEVALRKMDFKLLKDGAYKLHEKYHSGHKFEYLDLLKEIYIEISNNPLVPEDVKDILSPTIEDILSQGGVVADTATSPSESLNQQRVSTLTSLSYDVDNQNNQEEAKIDAFQAFSPQKQHTEPTQYFSQSPFSAEPFREFNMPKDEPDMTYHNEEQKEENPQPQEYQPQEYQSQEYQIQEHQPQEYQPQEYQEQPQEEIQEYRQEENKIEEIPQNTEKKSVAIFYAQDSSQEKINNIIELRDYIAKSKKEDVSLNHIMSLINEISTQANTNVIELQGVLEHLKNNNNPTNLITNSQSSMFSELLDSLKTSYSLYKNEENNQLNFIPLFGLSNAFICEGCSYKYINKNPELKPPVLECPKCKHTMYTDIYAQSENEKINIDYYNEALDNLANSKVWLLVHPSFSDKISASLIKTALKLSSNVEEVFVLDKDINTRESYKNLIMELKPNIKVNIQNTALEDFFNII